MHGSTEKRLAKDIAGSSVGALGLQPVNRLKAQTTTRKHAQAPLASKDYQPKSMLHVPETHVPRSRFPNIDFHTHLSWIDQKGKADVVRHTSANFQGQQIDAAKKPARAV